jgi:hypothetical protein
MSTQDRAGWMARTIRMRSRQPHELAFGRARSRSTVGALDAKCIDAGCSDGADDDGHRLALTIPDSNEAVLRICRHRLLGKTLHSN